ncbi:hypothetical protein F7725_018331, partial [Dissostichus mawsoni]
MRKKWEVALRREGFTASESSVICSEHFKQDEFDRTGQIVRLRDGVIPSIFSFPVHLQRPEKGRTTSTSRKAEESLSVAPQDDPEASTSHSQPQPNDDHSYVLPASPTALKARLNEALARVESLERERKNAMAREKRAKTTVRSLLGDLREKNLINEELKERLDFYSDLQIDFKQSRAMSTQRTTESLPSHSIYMVAVFGGWQAWLEQDDAGYAGEKMPGRPGYIYGCVALMLDAMAIRK